MVGKKEKNDGGNFQNGKNNGEKEMITICKTFDCVDKKLSQYGMELLQQNLTIAPTAFLGTTFKNDPVILLVGCIFPIFFFSFFLFFFFFSLTYLYITVISVFKETLM